MFIRLNNSRFCILLIFVHFKPFLCTKSLNTTRKFENKVSGCGPHTTITLAMHVPHCTQFEELRPQIQVSFTRNEEGGKNSTCVNEMAIYWFFTFYELIVKRKLYVDGKSQYWCFLTLNFFHFKDDQYFLSTNCMYFNFFVKKAQ